MEIPPLQKRPHQRHIHRALCRQFPVTITVLPQPLRHQIIDRRIGGTSVERQQGTVLFGYRFRGVHPCHVAHTTKVQEHQRSLGLDPFGTGKMEKRRQRRALPAHFHIIATKIPDHRFVQQFRQPLPVARLMGAAPAGVMRQRLAVKPHQFGLFETGQNLGMGRLDQFGCRIDTRLPRPFAKSCGNHLPVLVRIGLIGGFAKLENRLAIGQQHRRIHPVKRGARHRAKCPDRSCFQHPLSLRRCPRYIRAQRT